jgi:hypothetical protein
MMSYAKKMPFPAKKKPAAKDMALEIEIEDEGEEKEEEGEEEQSLDLKTMMAGEEGEVEAGPLAEASDEDLMAELKKRGLLPEGAEEPEAPASKPPFMK